MNFINPNCEHYDNGMTEYGTLVVTEYAWMYLFLAFYKSSSDTVNYPTFIALVSFSKAAELKYILKGLISSIF